MSRPKPIILLQNIDTKTYKVEQVLESDAVYAVFYQGKPINLRTLNHLVSYPGPKYKKFSFGSSGHAFNLCEKLNKMFKTSEFEVYKLITGIKVTEEDI